MTKLSIRAKNEAGGKTTPDKPKNGEFLRRAGGQDASERT